jgi:hypothetical protein
MGKWAIAAAAIALGFARKFQPAENSHSRSEQQLFSL